MIQYWPGENDTYEIQGDSYWESRIEDLADLTGVAQVISLAVVDGGSIYSLGIACTQPPIDYSASFIGAVKGDVCELLNSDFKNFIPTDKISLTTNPGDPVKIRIKFISP